MSKRKHLLLLDGNALLHRAWHAIPPLTTYDGLVVNAVYGFINIIEKMREQFSPEYMVVAWDMEGGTFRHEAYAQYKGTREKKADELYEQIALIQEMLKAYYIPSISVRGYEADDIIATLAKTHAKAGMQVDIVSGDMDLLQLVEPHIHVIAFVKGISETKVYDKYAVKERFGLEPHQLVDMKALMGDPSDNIPGIAGIGKKSAVELLQTHGSIDGLVRALRRGEVEKKYVKRLEGQEKNMKQWQDLVRLIVDVPLKEFNLEDARAKEPNVATLLPLLEKFEFRHLLKRYQEKYQKEKEFVKPAKKQALVEVKGLKGKTRFVHVRLSQPDLFDACPFEALVSDGTSMTRITDAQTLLSALEHAHFVVGYDLKFLMHLLGSRLNMTGFDVMVVAHLLSSHERTIDLGWCAKTYLGRSLSQQSTQEEELSAIIALEPILRSWLEKEGMFTLYETIEMPLLGILFEMETNGITLDKERLADLSQDFEDQLQKLTARIHLLAGEQFNIQSPSQLARILFEVLKLPTKKIKKIKTGYSTAASELEKLWNTHEIIPLMSQYREMAKLKSTYIDALPKLLGSDGKIHTTFNQTMTATGRLSSSEPNLQNIPVRTELGRKIRKAFVAKKDSVLVCCDYSQFELRLAAVISKDVNFIKAFVSGADIHRTTAAQILDKDESEVTKEERFAAKAINFGILYGMGARNLARSSGLSKENAQAFIDCYFALHPGIIAYIDEMKTNAHTEGYVQTLFGRRRYLPDIDSGVPPLRAAAERMAVNMPIQGTQADLVKMAMIRVDNWIQSTSLDVSLLLQVHDELVFEVAKNDVEQAIVEIKKRMQDIWSCDVPLIVDVEVGGNWGEVELYEV